MPLKVTPEQAADKWGRRLKSASQDIQNGVQRVDRAPGEAAAEQADRMLAGIQDAISSGRWQSRVRGVSLQEWKDAVINKGIPRLSQGVDAAMDKVLQRTRENFQNIEAVKAEVDRMPKTTLEDRISRMDTFVRGMARRKLS